MLIFFTNLRPMEFQIRYVALVFFSAIDSFWQFQNRRIQEYQVNAGVPEGFILGPTLFLLYINDLLDGVICNIASDLREQLELASELESGLQDIVNQDRKCLVDFNAGKSQLVSFGWFNNTGAILVKMDGSVFVEKSSFNMLGLTFSSKLGQGS